MDSYRVVTVTEDDLGLITGGPELRRTFLDQAIVLGNPLFAKTLSELKRIIEQRSSLIYQRKCNQEVYHLWTEQLWEKSRIVQQERSRLLASILARSTTAYRTICFKELIRLDMIYHAQNGS